MPDRSDWAYSTALMSKTQPLTRHLISINDLTNAEIETIFEVANGFLKELADPKIHYRIGRSTHLAAKSILASLFYEPSTRTRLSFESAMLRLGGANITSADPAVSSAAKGESLADTIRVISNYADIVVIRHPRDGAARLAAEYSQIPVINGGDGSHEHPTQTLCDLFTLRSKKKSFKNMKIAISGDLKGSRTIHSFVYALARFGATIDPLPAPGMELPAHVDRRLREEFHCRMVSKDPGQVGSIDALYVTADQPHQLSLIPDPEIDYGLLVQKKIDAVYVTRFQKERWSEKERDYPKVDAKFLNEAKYSDASVMHPVAARQRARRFARQRPPRHLFPAGRLRRSGAHGADLAAAAPAQEQVAASIQRRLRRAGSSDLRAADRHRPAMRQSSIASPAILPSGNTPPTSSTSSKRTARSAASCAASIARRTSRTRRANSSSPTRRARRLRPI